MVAWTSVTVLKEGNTSLRRNFQTLKCGQYRKQLFGETESKGKQHMKVKEYKAVSKWYSENLKLLGSLAPTLGMTAVL